MFERGSVNPCRFDVGRRLAVVLTAGYRRLSLQSGCSLWARRYDAIVVSDEPDVQWNRLRYLLSHGVKEGLVQSPLEWPGVHAAKALVHGEALEGVWFNRSKEWAARNRRLEFGHYDFATKYRVAPKRPLLASPCRLAASSAVAEAQARS